MSGASRVRSMNVADSEARPVLGLTGNKAQRSPGSRKSSSKPTRKIVKSKEELEMEDKNGHQPSPSLLSFDVPSILRRQESLYSNFSLSASCSSDASTDSFHSSASTGRIYRMNSTSSRRKQLASKSKRIVSNDISDSSIDGLQSKKRCAWVTPNTEMAPAKVRGAVNQLFQLTTCLGILIANFINYATDKIHPWGWRLSLGLATVPATVMFIGGLFLPETPNSLVEQGKLQEARQVLEKIRGTTKVDAEFSDLKDASDAARAIKDPFKNLLKRKNRPQLVIAAMGIPAFQQ